MGETGCCWASLVKICASAGTLFSELGAAGCGAAVCALFLVGLSCEKFFEWEPWLMDRVVGETGGCWTSLVRICASAGTSFSELETTGCGAAVCGLFLVGLSCDELFEWDPWLTNLVLGETGCFWTSLVEICDSAGTSFSELGTAVCGAAVCVLFLVGLSCEELFELEPWLRNLELGETGCFWISLVEICSSAGTLFSELGTTNFASAFKDFEISDSLSFSNDLSVSASFLLFCFRFKGKS